MAENLDLFPESPSGGDAADGKSVVHLGKPGVAHTKTQKTFERLVLRLGKLRRELEETRARWDSRLAFHTAEVRPLESRVAELRKEVVRLLVPFLHQTKHGRARIEEDLAQLILDQLDMIAVDEGGLKDADLSALFTELAGVSLEQTEEEAFRGMLDSMRDEFQRAGVNLDLGKLRPGMSDEEMAAAMADLENQFVGEAQNRQQEREKRPKTRAQLARELKERAMEEARKKNLGNLYRQLAKVLHPDLEQDPALRQQKEQAMKTLTLAYEQEDLHALLRLELEWIAKETSELDRLSEERLKIYIAVLREQADDLKAEIEDVGLHPRYMPVTRYVRPWVPEPDAFDREEIMASMRKEVEGLQLSIRNLRTPRARREVDEILRSYRGR
jgi:hypothetical protein